MGLTASAAGWFLLAAVPFGLFSIYSDLSRMKIPNLATDGLAASYIILGFIALPFDLYLWGFAHYAVMLIAGIALNAARVMGAGDSKFIAAAAPYIAIADLRLILFLFPAALLAAYVTHRAAKYSPLRRAVPHWESWQQGKRFPMGYPLGMTLILYLLIVLLTR
ncbi:hypothetical protein AB3Y40_03790 [Yoonia sp. R2331]|uniref:hypothetical protein n=1 Tax=Yoonia sp. R2331 TaxID=3237238 RepID=UPI0034E46C95